VDVLHDADHSLDGRPAVREISGVQKRSAKSVVTS